MTTFVANFIIQDIPEVLKVCLTDHTSSFCQLIYEQADKQSWNENAYCR